MMSRNRAVLTLLSLVIHYSVVNGHDGYSRVNGHDGSRPIVAITAPPALLDFETINQPLNKAEYAEIAAKYANMKAFVGMRRKPPGLGPSALYGFNLVIQGKNISWILNGSNAAGYTLIADFNANADLTDDKPIVFRDLRGKFVADINRTLVDTVDGRARKYRYVVRLTVDQTSSGGRGPSTVLKVQNRTARRGSLNLDGRRILFELRGSDGLYDDEFNSLFFDLNGDGRLEDEQYSPEEYKVRERQINIGPQSYEFTVDRFGDRLTLRPMGQHLADRADLRPGNPAPDFTFEDLDGKQRRLSEFAGKVVVVHVWAPWCAPSAAEAPKMATNYDRLSGKGFEIVSLNNGDTIDNLRSFAAKHRLHWVQGRTNESFLSLYRIDRYPLYFLIGRDGKIVSSSMRPGDDLYARVEELLAAR